MAEKSKTTKMRCHYEVMGLPRDATSDEIKKQYRKLALQWHPDRNHGQEELATQTFKEISAAYTVLSDSQERKWYDDHREAILRGRGDGTQASGDNSDEEGDDYTINVWQYFSSSCFSDYDDSQTGFYTVYRELFERIHDMEKEQTINGPDYPTFGNSSSPASEVYSFYSHWDNFVTSLIFSWEDKYNILEAPNRQVKRAMEKENSKFRDDARKEYISKIRSLVAYVKKRDERLTAIEEERSRKKKENEAKKEEEKKREKERRKEVREQWKNNMESEIEARQEERKMAFLLADNESEDEMHRSSKSSRKGKKGKSKRFADEEDEFGGPGLVSSSGKFENFESEGVSQVNSMMEGMVVSNADGTSEKQNEVDSTALESVPVIDVVEDDGDGEIDEYEGEEEGFLFGCEVCSKNFKSEAQLTQHLASKVHRKKLQEMQKQSKKGKKN